MFIRVAIPSMIMVCMEWWTYEMGGILAGLISEIELGAQSILHQLFTILYMVNIVTSSLHMLLLPVCGEWKVHRFKVVCVGGKTGEGFVAICCHLNRQKRTKEKKRKNRTNKESKIWSHHALKGMRKMAVAAFSSGAAKNNVNDELLLFLIIGTAVKVLSFYCCCDISG